MANTKRFSFRCPVKFAMVACMSVLVLATSSCYKDYDCRIPAGTVITNSDGSQTTLTADENRNCSKCSKEDVKSLEDKGYSCSVE
ncbi:MAG: hypothetical protein MUF42_08295 [Cytophagaceae bacterium]|jgi:hypothetical protein|nr:hypothetical protein [Cytophagaceae bacterium]